ncbi:MAG: replicative DNA helicase [Candidatus Thiosymbion ectosymbiont of Robbea hypermnestra]|nr:replicative DNA helicase [Candidatus Thiosymbion ectosymbiont of Robbea hypermnestra]
MSEPDVSAYPEVTADPQDLLDLQDGQDGPYGAENLRVPPHSIQAEQSLLGGLMLDNETWDQVADKVAAGDFYRREHRLIFDAVRRLVDADQPFDVVTLAESLERTGTLDDAGGLPYLGSIAKDTPSAANVVAYAKIVRFNSVLRQLIHAGTQIADLAYSPGNRADNELLDEAERRVFEIAEQLARGGGFKEIKSLLVTAIDRIDRLYNSDEHITGLPTGFTDFDERTSGLQKSDLIIVAGRPSMGKTSFAMNIAENVSLETQRPVAVFSMEMPGEALTMRMMSSLGRIDQHRVRTGKLQEDEWPRLTSAVNMLSETKLFIDDTPALSPIEVRARARRLKREHGDLALIIIDYLQLMQAPEARENRVAEISAISRSLKSLARELDIPVIALSQLNRSLEQRPNKRPIMSDLRESGAIEQDADLIAFIYRDEVYNEDTPDKGIAEIIIAKQRNGPIGTTRLTFLGKYTKFENYIADVYQDPGY